MKLGFKYLTKAIANTNRFLINGWFRASQSTNISSLPEEIIPSGQRNEEYYIPLHPNEKLRIVFLFQVASLWPNWKTIWEACLKDIQIEAKIVLVERNSSDTKLNFLNAARNFLIKNNIPFIVSGAFSLEVYRPHVILLQTPYTNIIPSKYSLEELKKLGCRIAYVPYGIEIGGGASNLTNQFNSTIHQQAWKIFARSERHLKMFSKYCSVGSAHVVVSGHPRMDLIRNLNKVELDPIIINKINGRKVFLWCPHFSIDKNAWSTFLIYYEYILDFFQKREDLYLIVRPHPLLFNQLNLCKIWDNEKINFFKNSFNEKTNSHLDTDENYLVSFKLSDAIIADAGSFLLEYFSTKKPVAYLYNESGPGLNDDGDIIQHLYVLKSAHDISTFIKMVQDGHDPKKESRCNAIPNYLYQNNNNIGTFIKDYMLTSINLYDKPPHILKTNDYRHEAAEKFWQTAENTYLASPEYYDTQEKILKLILADIKNLDSVLDIGCGDGRFTYLYEKIAKNTKGIDISSKLIDKAKRTYSSESVSFAVESLSRFKTCHRYDMVSCMGVTSGLIDDEVFLNTIDLLVASCKAGGYLLLKESLSLMLEQHLNPETSGYTAVYRNITAYINCFTTRGCKLIAEYELAKNMDKQLTNRILLFSIPATQILNQFSSSMN